LRDYCAETLAYNVKLPATLPLNCFRYFFVWQTLVLAIPQTAHHHDADKCDSPRLPAPAISHHSFHHSSLKSSGTSPKFFQDLRIAEIAGGEIASAAECNSANMTFLS
jgi:hypothetical protein